MFLRKLTINEDPELLRGAVCQAYSAAADAPEGRHPFPVGRGFAESLGYPAALLERVPDVAADAFAGVSDVSARAALPAGATVLDLGCGAGLDAIIAATRVGARGRVIGVDFSESMLRRARAAALQAGAGNLCFLLGDGEQIPLEDGAIDVALVNGIFNLNPHRRGLFGELARVLRPGGRVYVAELILRAPLEEEARSRASWFA